MTNKFLCFNLSQVYKVISSRLYCEGDIIYLFINYMNKNQVEASKKLLSCVNLKLITSNNVLPLSQGFFGVVFYTYFLNIRLFKIIRGYFYRHLIKCLDLSDGDIFIFHTTPPVASLIMNEKKVNLLEDGFLNYGFARFSKFHNFVRFIFGYSRHYRLGCEENVDTIYLKYPTSDKLTVEQRNKAKKLVIDYYSINVGDISSMFYCYSDSVIILTQPLNEKEYCSFTEKIYLYQLLSDFLSEKHPGKSKYIKLHPLEDDEKNHNAYASIVGIDGIVENDFPSEILGNLLKDVCFYSFFSSSGVDNNFTVLKSDYYQGIRDIIVSGRLHGLV